jgi:hypothetical protein
MSGKPESQRKVGMHPAASAAGDRQHKSLNDIYGSEVTA